MAMFAVTCCLNHSCKPNVRVLWCNNRPAEPVQLEVVALRDIRLGEELMFSYIDESLSFSERQEALADYGFICGCERCGSESKGC